MIQVTEVTVISGFSHKREPSVFIRESQSLRSLLSLSRRCVSVFRAGLHWRGSLRPGRRDTGGPFGAISSGTRH